MLQQCYPNHLTAQATLEEQLSTIYVQFQHSITGFYLWIFLLLSIFLFLHDDNNIISTIAFHCGCSIKFSQITPNLYYHNT